MIPTKSSPGPNPKSTAKKKPEIGRRSRRLGPLTRVQIEMEAEKNREIEDLMDLCDVRTKKELFDNAISFLSWGIRAVAKGRTIASVEEDDPSKPPRVVHMPIFDAVVRNTEQD